MSGNAGKKIIIGLAPMAGFSDSAMRKVSLECGADFTVTEMVSAKGLYYNNEKTDALMKIEQTRPCGIQLFGSEEKSLEYASHYIAEKYHPDFIDFNMGCPTPKIVSGGDGSALLKDFTRAVASVKAVINGADGIPVTVKMRVGWETVSDDIPLLAKRLEEIGVKGMAVHGRTSRQMYRPPVYPEAIKKIKQAVSIPVLANGDVTSPEAALEMLNQTDADGLLIGRGALGNPFIFSMIKSYISTGSYTPPTDGELFDTALKQFELSVAEKGEKRACLEARSQLAFYFKGKEGAPSKRRELSAATAAAEITEILKSLRREKK